MVALVGIIMVGRSIGPSTSAGRKADRPSDRQNRQVKRSNAVSTWKQAVSLRPTMAKKASRRAADSASSAGEPRAKTGLPGSSSAWARGEVAEGSLMPKARETAR